MIATTDLPTPFADLAAGFRIAYVPVAGSRDLVIALSHDQRLSFVRWRFRHNALLLADIDERYFLTRTGPLLAAIDSFAEGFDRVLFLGFSKGGFGALLLAALSASRCRTRTWRALAFSPQTRLAADSSSMFYPSARRVVEEAQQSPSLLRRLEAFGDAGRLLVRRNVQAMIVYGLRNPVDSEAAHALARPNVRLYPLPFAMHNTLFPFVLRGKGPDVMHRRLIGLYQTKDPDMAATRPPDLRQVAEDVCQTFWLPGLNDLIEEAIRIG